ncbi:DUF3817 domain-containing protein [Blastococcus sp. SYSU D00820]
MSPRTAVPLFRIVAVAEALSWLGLLIGMYVKWIAGTSEVGVQVFGPIHGGVFVLYCLVTLVTARALRWSAWTTLVALACSVPPFATVAFERWALRTGRLDAAPAAA